MVHGENTAKMEFLTAIVKILLPRTSIHLLDDMTEKLVWRWPRHEDAERIPGLSQRNQGNHKVLSQVRSTGLLLLGSGLN